MSDDRGGAKRSITVDTEDYLVTVAPKPSADAEWRKLRRDDTAFYIVVVGLVMTCAVAGWFIVFAEATATNVALKEWGRTIFAAIVTGFIGFAFAKK